MAIRIPIIQASTIGEGFGLFVRVEGPGVGSVEVEEHADEEEEEEGDGVEEEDVGDVGDVGGGEEGHLFFGGAHEEEAGCVEEL